LSAGALDYGDYNWKVNHGKQTETSEDASKSMEERQPLLH